MVWGAENSGPKNAGPSIGMRRAFVVRYSEHIFCEQHIL